MSPCVSCHRCGQPLRTEASRARGYGPACWRTVHDPTGHSWARRAQTIRPLPTMRGVVDVELPFYEPQEE